MEGNIETISNDQIDKFFDSRGESGLSDSPSPVIDAPASETVPAQEHKETPAVTQPATEHKKDDPATELSNIKRALAEEREMRKNAARDVSELKSKNERIEQTFQKMMEKIQKAEQPKVPTYDEDPAAHLNHRLSEIEKESTTVKTKIEMTERQQQKNVEMQQFVNRYAIAANEFGTQNPEFKDAYNYLIQSRGQEYVAAGFTGERLEQMLQEDEMAIVAQAFSDGANPAERLFNLAKVRGFKRMDSTQNATQPKVDLAKNASDKIKTISEGLKTGASLSNAGADVGEDAALTIEQISELSNEDFDKHFEKFVKQQKHG